MHYIFVLAALTLPALGVPLVEQRSPAPVRFARCLSATNCEVVRDETGNATGIKFKRGTEPGTAWHDNLMKRDDAIATEVTLGDSLIEFGCYASGETVDPAAMLGNLASICQDSGACVDTQAYTEEINYVTPNQGQLAPELWRSKVTWTLNGEGQYPIPLHNAFVDSIRAIGAHNPRTWLQTYGRTGKETSEGACTIVQQTNYINVARYVTPAGGQQSLQGFMTAKISIPDAPTGFCDVFENDKDALEAVGNSIKDFEEVLGPIFGVISTICGSLSSS